MIEKELKINLFKKIFIMRFNREPYPYQIKLCEDESKFKIVNKARQIGISDGEACWDLINAIIENQTRLIVSPSQRQSKRVMDFIYFSLNKLREKYRFKIIEETKSSIQFYDGGEIYSLPNSPNTIRGFKADHLKLDEFAFFLLNTDKDMLRAIEPSISRGGSLSIVSTPNGTDNVYHEIWTNQENYDDYSRHLINWTECPDLDKEFILKKKKTDELTYRQEYNNEFLEEVDEQEFPFALIQKIINMELEYEELRKDKIYLAGMDIGRRRDLSAIAIFEEVEGRYILRKCITWFNKKWRWQEEQVAGLLNNYTFKSFLIDATGIGSEIAENLAEDFSGIVKPILFDNQIKQDMVLGLKEKMQDRRMEIPNDPMVINNIRSIQRNWSSGGLLRFDSKRDKQIGHADLFWGIALAMYEDKGGTRDFFIE